MESLDKSADFNAEVYKSEQELIEKQLKTTEEKIKKLTTENPQLRFLPVEQLRETLLNMEADTYAEFIRAGRISNNPSSVLKEVLSKKIEVKTKAAEIQEVIQEAMQEAEIKEEIKNDLNSFSEKAPAGTVD